MTLYFPIPRGIAKLTSTFTGVQAVFDDGRETAIDGGALWRYLVPIVRVSGGGRWLKLRLVWTGIFQTIDQLRARNRDTMSLEWPIATGRRNASSERTTAFLRSADNFS